MGIGLFTICQKPKNAELGRTCLRLVTIVRPPAISTVRPFLLSLVVIAASLLLTFVFRWVALGNFPNEAAYNDSSLLPSIFGDFRTAGALAIMFAVAFAGYPVSFSNFPQQGLLLRVTWLLSGSPLVFTAVTIAPSPLFDNPRLVDRLLVLGLFAVSAFRPSFIGITILYSWLTTLEEFYPLLSTPGWTDRTLNEALGLAVFSFTLIVYLMRGHSEFGAQAIPRPSLNAARPFIIGIVGAAYFIPGFAKLMVGFVELELIARVLWAKQALLDWNPLAGMNSAEFSEVLIAVNPGLVLGAMTVELILPLFLAFPRLQPLILASFAIFHGVIFFMTGVGFWKWVVIDVGLAVYLLWEDRRGELLAPRSSPRGGCLSL